MKHLQVNSNPEVKTRFDGYPAKVRPKLLHLRKLILEVARATDGIEQLEETLKWGEPGYLTKHGSTIRIDWKEKTPDQYAMYFKCTSRLIPTFRTIYSTTFTYAGDRAIVFGMHDAIPEEALKQCIQAALTYHRVKHLPTLGIP